VPKATAVETFIIDLKYLYKVIKSSSLKCLWLQYYYRQSYETLQNDKDIISSMYQCVAVLTLKTDSSLQM